MANGFSLGILQMQKEVTKDATPQYKVEPYGFLASLYAAHSRGVIKNMVEETGHYRTVKVKAKKRLLIGDTRTTPSCDTVITVPYTEQTVTLTGYRETAISITDETIAAFDAYASAIVAASQAGIAPPSAGQIPGGGLMFEFFDSLQVAANGLLSGVDYDLVALAVAAIGVNARVSSAAAQTINIPQDATTNLLSDGIPQIWRDLSLNNMNGKPIIVGAGFWDAFARSQAAIGGANQAGIDTRIQAAAFDYFRDEQVPDALGADNQIIVYEKDAVQIVEYLKYTGFKAGMKGTSIFGTLMLPYVANGQLIPVSFDYQLKYQDCPTDMTVDGYESTSVDRGWVLIVSKTFGLYTIPSTAYQGLDNLAGNRGSLRYLITNT